MANTYLIDISNKPEQGINAIDTRYNVEPNTVDVTTYWNPQGIHFKTGEGEQYGLTYDPAAQKHWLSDPNKFYGIMGLPNPLGQVLTNNGMTNNGAINPPTPEITAPKSEVVSYNTADTTKKIEDVLGSTKPPEGIITPDKARETYQAAISSVQNPSTVPYEKMTSNEALINQQYDALKTSLVNDLMAGIQKSRSEYEAKAKGLPSIYDPLRSEASVMALQQEQKIREAMANSGLAQAARGVGGSGLNIQLQNMADIGKQQAIQKYNTEQAKALNDINLQLADLVNQEILGTNKIQSQTNVERIKALLEDKRAVESGNYQRQQGALTSQLTLADILGKQYQNQQNIEQSYRNALIEGYGKSAGLGQTQQQLDVQKENFARDYGLNIAKVTDTMMNNRVQNEVAIAGLTGTYKGMPTMAARKLASELAIASANVDSINTNTKLTQKELDNYDALMSMKKEGMTLSNENQRLLNKYQEMYNQQAPDFIKEQIREMKTKSDAIIKSGNLDQLKFEWDKELGKAKLEIEKKLADNSITNDQARIALGYYEANQANYRAELSKEATLAAANVNANQDDKEEMKMVLENAFYMKNKSMYSESAIPDPNNTNSFFPGFIREYSDDDIAKYLANAFPYDPPDVRDKKIAAAMATVGIDRNKVLGNIKSPATTTGPTPTPAPTPAPPQMSPTPAPAPAPR